MITHAEPRIDQVVIGTVATPLGAFGAVLTPAGLGRLSFPSDPVAVCEAWIGRWAPEARLARDARGLSTLAEQLTAYLEGDLREFTVPLDMHGAPFQLDVWRALREIPYGETRSYAALAAAIGRPSAVRAVGLANGANPAPVVVPCHRVIGSDGTLTGYGGGLALKRQLLSIEGASRSSAPGHRQGSLL